jgi:hypothetical protein
MAGSSLEGRDWFSLPSLFFQNNKTRQLVTIKSKKVLYPDGQARVHGVVGISASSP